MVTKIFMVSVLTQKNFFSNIFNTLKYDEKLEKNGVESFFKESNLTTGINFYSQNKFWSFSNLDKNLSKKWTKILFLP